MKTKTKEEEYVAGLCHRAFFPLWTYANPRGKDHQELCDLLVVCPPDVIIVSVSGTTFKDTGNGAVDWDRWRRKALKHSVKQLFGAERRLGLVDEVTTQAGTAGLRLPDRTMRRVHRVAVLIGGEKKVSLSSGELDYRKSWKYVHVLDSISFDVLVRELDTITDFVAYLRTREEFQGQVMMEGGEQDLLALYIQHGQKLPDKDLICLGEDLWRTFNRSEQYRAKKDADRISYRWDKIIEMFCEQHLKGELLGEQSLNAVDETIRIMAREDRFTRRGLAKSFVEFLAANSEGTSRARLCSEPGLATYVFLGCPVSLPRKDRIAELHKRCLIARCKHREKQTVVGIATETPKPGQRPVFELMNLHIPEITSQHEAQAKQFQDRFGFFKNMTMIKLQEEEYPG